MKMTIRRAVATEPAETTGGPPPVKITDRAALRAALDAGDDAELDELLDGDVDLDVRFEWEPESEPDGITVFGRRLRHRVDS